MPYKTTQVQVPEEGIYKRANSCNWFLQAMYDDVPDPKLKSLTDKSLVPPEW
jgi:hypothetical protein